MKQENGQFALLSGVPAFNQLSYYQLIRAGLAVLPLRRSDTMSMGWNPSEIKTLKSKRDRTRIGDEALDLLAALR